MHHVHEVRTQTFRVIDKRRTVSDEFTVELANYSVWQVCDGLVRG